MFPTLLTATLLALAPVARHDTLQARLAHVDARMAREGASVDLLLARASLLRRHGDLEGALADVRRSAALAPDSIDVAFARAQVLVEAGRVSLARPDVERVMLARPAAPEALLLGARVLTDAGELDAALARYEAAFAHLAVPRPEHYLAQAELLRRIDARASRGPARALEILERGIERLGAVPALVLAAIEDELNANDPDAALTRLDSLRAHASRQDHWLARRAEILERAGRAPDALEAWRAARASLEALPTRHKATPRTRELRVRIELRIEFLTRGLPDAPTRAADAPASGS